jgi:hypothetical protein
MYQLEDMTKRFELRPDGQQIFHFYRNTIINAGTEEERRFKVYVFGTKEAGQETIYNYIMPDNKLISTRGDSLIIK